MSDPILHEILLKLGRIEEGQEQLRDDFDKETDRSRENRKDLHGKVDSLSDRIGHVETTIQVAGQVTAQARDKIDALETKINTDVQPTVDEFKRMKMIGWSAVGLVGLGGTAFGASLIWWGEQTISAIRHFLRIP